METAIVHTVDAIKNAEQYLVIILSPEARSKAA
jgi:hypothetical protein